MMNLFVIPLVLILLGLSPHDGMAKHNDPLSLKMPTRMADLLRAKDFLGYAKIHGIEIHDGMIRVIIEVDESFRLDAIASKYGLKEYRQRGNIVTASVRVDHLEALCQESSVIFVRFPVGFSE